MIHRIPSYSESASRVLRAGAFCLLLTAVPLGCLSKEPPVGKREAARTSAESRQRRADSDDRYTDLRHRMVREQIEGRDVSEPRVLEAMRRVARHRFVPEGARDAAYDDHPLPIGHGQTISQPYIVALMTQLARPKPEDRALDVGTGSGYQAAVLAELVERVYSIEIVCPLADEADKRLQGLGYENVEVRCGDGYQGWPEHAPFDVIIVAAAPDHVPEPLVEQLAVGGRMVIPVGSGFDMELLLIEKIDDGTTRRRTIAPVLFVPMTGQAQDPRTARER